MFCTQPTLSSLTWCSWWAIATCVIFLSTNVQRWIALEDGPMGRRLIVTLVFIRY